MLGRLFLLFTLVPLVELWLLVQIGEVVGLPATLGAVLATGALGASLARREGMRTLHRWQNSLSQGQLPDEGIASGLLILVGGIFLITPGILTDVIGLSLLIPPLRRTVGHALTRRVQGKINVHGSFGDSLRGPPSAHPGDAEFTNVADIIDVDAFTREQSTSSAQASGEPKASAPPPASPSLQFPP